jgi:hypothetical protein
VPNDFEDLEEFLITGQLIAAAINAAPRSRERLEAQYGQVWDTEQLTADFEILDFATPRVFVVRKSDDAPGHLYFQDHPRFYFNFEN